MTDRIMGDQIMSTNIPLLQAEIHLFILDRAAVITLLHRAAIKVIYINDINLILKNTNLMLRKIAYKYCKEINKKLLDINGILLTPGYNYEFVEFEKIYVVGSFITDKEFPNDLDILIFCKVGSTRIKLENGIIDKEYLSRYGIKRTKLSIDYALKWLTKGMKKVHRLDANQELTDFPIKIELYPKFSLKNEE